MAELTDGWWIVVVNWNGKDDTIRCLDSLACVAGVQRRVLCVDNGSTDGSVDAIRSAHPDVTILEAGANLGYAGGNNVGIRHALDHGAEWVVLLNNDATAAPDVVEAFAAAAARWPRAGILAGKVMLAGEAGRIWWAGQRVSLVTGYSGRPRGYRCPDGLEFSREEPTERAVGALMALSRSLLDEVGSLDEELFAYVEDIDLSLRARRAGYTIVFVPEARAWHAVGGSTGGEYGSTHTLFYGVRNTIVVCERHRPLGPVGSRLRRLAIVASYLALVIPRRPWRRSLGAVREGFVAARTRKMGERAAAR